MGYFKDVTPESAGISSKGILNFLDRMEESQIELHSFMVIRHGQCAAKAGGSRMMKNSVIHCIRSANR
mgnify:CR=1 FL=1